MERLTLWFTANYLQVNATKTQAMTLWKSQYPYNLFIGDKSIEIEPTLKVLGVTGVTFDRDLSFKPHVAITLKKASAKIAALWRIKRLVPSDIMISQFPAVTKSSTTLAQFHKVLISQGASVWTVYNFIYFYVCYILLG